MSMIAAYALAVSLFAASGRGMWLIPAGPVIIFLALDADFFRFLYREKGFPYLLGSIAFTFLDSLVLGAGAAAGLCRFLVNREQGKD